MRNSNLIVTALVLASSSLVACVTEDGEITEEGLADGEELADVESSLCYLPQTPPPNDGYWGFTTVNQYKTIDAGGYGTGECDRAVVGFGNAANAAVAPLVKPTTQLACESTRVGATFYTRNSANEWTVAKSVAVSGVWSAEYGCRFTGLSHSPASSNTPEIRVTAQASKTTCTSGGLCGIQRGLDLRFTGRSAALN
jgi:hypothetical protein